MTDRLDASALERELALAAVADPEVTDRVHVPPAQWCDVIAGAVFATVVRLHMAGESVNAITVGDAMGADGQQPPTWLPEPSWVRFSDAKLSEFHARAELRRTRQLARDLLKLCDSGAVEAARLMAQDIAGVQDEAQPEASGPWPLSAVAVDAARAALSPEDRPRVHLGLDCLHEAVGGLLPGSMVVVAADTGVGKSSLVLSMALASARRGHRVGIISCEDPPELWGTRAAASLSGVSSLRMMRGAAATHEGDRARLERVIADPPQPFVALDCQVGKPETAVLSSMRRMARAGAQMVVVDYVQTILCSDKGLQRKDQVREIAARLKGQAAALGIALVLVSQLRRPPSEGGKVREPTKHDLKETGDLENAAELIALLWLPVPDRTDVVSMKLEKGKWGVTKRKHVLRRDESGSLVEAEDAYLDEAIRGQVDAWDGGAR